MKTQRNRRALRMSFGGGPPGRVWTKSPPEASRVKVIGLVSQPPPPPTRNVDRFIVALLLALIVVAMCVSQRAEAATLTQPGGSLPGGGTYPSATLTYSLSGDVLTLSGNPTERTGTGDNNYTTVMDATAVGGSRLWRRWGDYPVLDEGGGSITITGPVVLRIFTTRYDNFVVASVTVEVAPPATDCKATFPALSNTTGYAIHYRLVHSVDGVVAQKKVDPGGALPESVHDVTCGGTYRIEYAIPDKEGMGDGVWYLPDSETSPDEDDWEDPGTPEVPDVPPETEDPPKPEDPKPDKDENGKPLPPAPRPPAPPWENKPPGPENDMSNLLDRDTYREGVGKIVGELQEQTKALKNEMTQEEKNELLAAAASAADSMVSAATERASEINDALPSSFTAANVAETSKATGSASFYTFSGSGTPAANLFGWAALNFAPATYWPNWETWAGWIRELMLIGFCIIFCFLTQRRFERYYLAWWGVTEKTTKVEPVQMTVPGAGWGKQLALALTLTAAFTGCIAVVIASINSNLSSLISGANIGNVMAQVASSSSTMFSGMGPAYEWINAFVPVPAIFQLVGAYWIICWTVGPLFTVALAVSKFVHP